MRDDLWITSRYGCLNDHMKSCTNPINDIFTLISVSDSFSRGGEFLRSIRRVISQHLPRRLLTNVGVMVQLETVDVGKVIDCLVSSRSLSHK